MTAQARIPASAAAADPLVRLLEEQPWILADGATGTSLFDVGLQAGEAPECWNIERSGAVLALNRAFADAGAQLLLTNSFGGNRYRLRLHGLDGRTADINRAAAAIAREAAEASGAVVAGSVGPTGEILKPLGMLPRAAATDAFEEQGAALLEGGADLLWGETLSAREEIDAFLAAMERLRAPFALTLSFDTAGRTMMGLAPSDLSALVKGCSRPPSAYGANCGTGASDLLASLLEFEDGPPLIAKANAGVPELRGGEVHFLGTPESMGSFACLARDAGARIIGGCCGSTPVHIARMRQALEETPGGPRPDRETIERRTGAFMQRLPAAVAGQRASRRKRRSSGCEADARK